MGWWSAQAHSGEEWEQISTRAFVDLRCRPYAASFTGSLRQAALQTAALNWVETDPLNVTRPAEAARRYRGDALLFTLQLRGRSTVEQHGRAASVAPGSGVLYDPRNPYVLDFRAPSQSLVVVGVDRRDLPYSQADIDRLVARRIAPDAPGMASLAGMLRGVGADTADTAVLIERLLPQLLTMIGDDMLESAPGDAASRRALRQVQEWVRRNIDQPALSVAALASAFYMSERSVYALFETNGDTPAAWIRRQRAAHARQLLATTSDPVAAVGVACGYPDATVFTRFFKGATGTTPRAYRDAAAAGRDSDAHTPQSALSRGRMPPPGHAPE